MKKHLTLFIAIGLLTILGINAQTILIGDDIKVNGPEDYPAPYGNYYWGAKHQMIYTASELQAKGAEAGDLLGIGFIVNQLYSGTPLDSFTISLGTTSDTLFASTDFYTGLTEVFKSNPYQPIAGFNLHTFENPYTWDGTSNIIIEVCFNNDSYITNEGMEYSTYSENMSNYSYDDDWGNCHASSGNLSMDRANVIFKFHTENDLRIEMLSDYSSQCSFPDSYPIQIKVTNVGPEAQTEFKVNYQINEGDILEETITGNYAQGEAVSHTFTDFPEFFENGEYSIKAWINHEADQNRFNDTTALLNFTNLPSPEARGAVVCSGNSSTLIALSDDYSIVRWYDSESADIPIYEGTEFTTPELTETTLYYLSGMNTAFLSVDTVISEGEGKTVELGGYSGDDRGGIAVTPHYLYVVGDDNTARVDAHNLSNPVSLPRMDGIFSDLIDGTLYSLYNSKPNGGHLNDGSISWPFTLDAIVELDDSLSIDSSSIMLLSDTIALSENSGVFAGENHLILYDGGTDILYNISTSDGQVSIIDTLELDLRGSENWASWGWSDHFMDSLSIVFATREGDSLVRMNLVSGIATAFARFDDISDLASLTYSPWYNRMYWHYEGSGDFGGSEESAGYIAGVSNTVGDFGCRNLVVVTVVDTCTQEPNSITDIGLEDIKVFPNPTTGLLHIEYNEISSAQIQVSVINMVGKVLESQFIDTENNTGRFMLNLGDYETGVYFVNILLEKQETKTIKVLLQ